MPLEEVLVLQLLLDELVSLLLMTLFQIPDAGFPVCGEEKEQEMTHPGLSAWPHKVSQAQETSVHTNSAADVGGDHSPPVFQEKLVANHIGA